MKRLLLLLVWCSTLGLLFYCATPGVSTLPLNDRDAGTNDRDAGAVNKGLPDAGNNKGSPDAGNAVVADAGNVSPPDAGNAVLVPAVPHYMLVTEFGAKGDGTTWDYPAIQDCFTWSWSHFYAECRFPAGSFLTDLTTVQLAPDTSGFAFAARAIGESTFVDSLGSVIIYNGTGIAMQAMNHRPTPTTDDNIVNGRIENLTIQFNNPAPNGIGLDLNNWGQGQIKGVNIQAAPASASALSLSSQGQSLLAGIRCAGCNISWFDKVSVSGQVPPTSYARDGIWITTTPFAGQASGGAIWIKDSFFFLLARGVHIGADPHTTAQFMPTVSIKDSHFDDIGVDVYVSNEGGPVFLENLQIVGNNSQLNSMLDQYNGAFLVIDHSAGAGKLVINGTLSRNHKGCSPGDCSQTHTAGANKIRRVGSTVTVTVAESCVFFQGDVAGKVQPFPRSKVYKSGDDPAFPSGLKTVTGLLPAGCTSIDPNSSTATGAGATCPKNPCTGFTYAEAGPATSTSAPASFGVGDYWIQEIGNDRGNAGSVVRLAAFDNDMQGYKGSYASLSLDAQGDCANGTCNVTTLQLGPRNRVTTASETYAARADEVMVSNTPRNSAKVYPTLLHWPHRERVTMGNASMTVHVPDVQDNCTCRDLKTGANLCPDPPVSDGDPYPNFGGLVTMTGASGSVVDLDCW